MSDIAQEITPIPESGPDVAIWQEKTSGDLRHDLHALKHEDSTFSGAMEIDGSTDISTALYVDGSQDVLNTLGCLSDFAVVGDFSIDGTAVFGGDVSIDGNLEIDGTVDFNAGVWFDDSVDVQGLLYCGSNAEITGSLEVDSSSDFSAVGIAGDITIGDNTTRLFSVHNCDVSFPDGTVNGATVHYGQGSVIKAWGRLDLKNSTVLTAWNISTITRTAAGVADVSFTGFSPTDATSFVVTATNQLTNNWFCYADPTATGFVLNVLSFAGVAADSSDVGIIVTGV